MTKYQLERAKDELKIAEQRVIKILDDQLALFQADIDILKKITNENELNQYKKSLKTSLSLYQLQELKPEQFLKEKENIIKELNKHIAWTNDEKSKFLEEIQLDLAKQPKN